VGVDHGGFDVFMAEEFLYGADIVAVLEKMCGEGVAEGVRGNLFIYACVPGGFTNGFLKDTFVEVVS